MRDNQLETTCSHDHPSRHSWISTSCCLIQSSLIYYSEGNVHQCPKHLPIRTPHEHFPKMYNLPSERYSNPNAPSMNVNRPSSLVVPEKAGIHRGRYSTPPSRSDPSDYLPSVLPSSSTLHASSDQAPNVTYIQHISRQTKASLLYRV